MSALRAYPDRRNAHHCWLEFAQAGSDVRAVCTRQRKVDARWWEGS